MPPSQTVTELKKCAVKSSPSQGIWHIGLNSNSMALRPAAWKPWTWGQWVMWCACSQAPNCILLGDRGKCARTSCQKWHSTWQQQGLNARSPTESSTPLPLRHTKECRTKRNGWNQPLTSCISSPSRNLTGFRLSRWSNSSVFASARLVTIHLTTRQSATTALSFSTLSK